MSIEKEINERKEYLETIISSKEHSTENEIEGYLKIVRHKNGWQYYYKEKENDEKYHYICKGNRTLAEKLAQQKYDQKVLLLARKEKELIDQLDKFYKNNSLDSLYSNLPPQRQDLINPIEKPIDKYIKEWLNLSFEKNGFQENMPEYYTNKGEQMRSKSEVLIANMLEKYGLPYHYEKPLLIKGGGKIYPDFTILEMQTRREIYWEHFGMLDDAEYLDKEIKKLNYYEQNGYILGERLIITYETVASPLNMKVIEKKIQALL